MVISVKIEKSKIENLIKELHKQFQEQKTCSKKGHLEEEVLSIFSYGFHTKAHCYCKKCNTVYLRRATHDEISNFNRSAYGSFTI